MVYWHVDKRAVCIYSQLKTVSSSEVAAMLESLLRHGTEMPIEKNDVDSHGQSAVAFAFCHLLNFQLLPRLKRIHRQKLTRPTMGQPEAYPHLILRSQHLAVPSCGGAVTASRHLSTIFVTG
jgi:TnpA family transposase